MQVGIAVNDLAGAVRVTQELHSSDQRIDDAALVIALQSGSEDAFSRLIDLYHKPVYSLVARNLQDPADAADITQEVFIKIYRGIGSFHGGSSLRTWIYRIALHEASNQRRWWIRHKRREIAIESDDLGRCPNTHDSRPIADSIADPGPSPFDSVAQRDLSATIACALSRVPESFRSVLVLREIEGLSYEEIADVLKIQPGTVKSRLMRGRQALRAELAPLQTPQLAFTAVKKAAGKSSAPAVLPEIKLADLSQPINALIAHVEDAFHAERPLRIPPQPDFGISSEEAAL